jgi:photosystem II stability/assembly factor-like uncharacterized protein
MHQMRRTDVLAVYSRLWRTVDGGSSWTHVPLTPET